MLLKLCFPSLVLVLITKCVHQHKPDMGGEKHVEKRNVRTTMLKAIATSG